MKIVLKSGSLNLLESSGPVQACNGTALTSVGLAEHFIHPVQHRCLQWVGKPPIKCAIPPLHTPDGQSRNGHYYLHTPADRQVDVHGDSPCDVQ